MAVDEDALVATVLGGLALSVVRPSVGMIGVRALVWHRDLLRLGIDVPFFVVHDLGLLFSTASRELTLGPRAAARELGPAALPASFEAYAALVGEIAESEASRRAETLKLSDELVVVLLARILSSVSGTPAPGLQALPIDPALMQGLEHRLVALFRSVQRRTETEVLVRLTSSRLQLLTIVDALDLDTLRFLGLLGPDASGALSQVDMLSALSSPAANDVVNFSLELLPSILETRRNAVTSAFAAHGYAGVGTKGSLDSLVLTELAWDDLEFARRLLDRETLFYAREQASEEAGRLHYVVVDASASMRGERQVFARGLAIALGKKLLLAGEEVVFRFFDSRLYDLHRAKGGMLPVAHLLGFKGERGRNPARVFAQLGTELALLRTRDRREPVLHLITHAALHIPRDLVKELTRSAHVAGVFILPSGGVLALDYLDLLASYKIVDHGTLSSRAARKEAATEIVDEAARNGEAPLEHRPSA